MPDLALWPAQPAEFEQVQPERFEPGDHTVHSGLVLEATGQKRVRALRLGVEGRERAQHLRPEMAANAYLVEVLRVVLLTGHEVPFWPSLLKLPALPRPG